jgi:protein-tyrosine phosphatase
MSYYINTSEPSDILGDGSLFVSNAKGAEEHCDDFDFVVNCTKHLPFYTDRTNQRRVRLPVDDCPEEAFTLFAMLRETKLLTHIDEAISHKENVLIHCMAGAQRSAAVAACFLVANRGFTPEDAIREVRARRPAAFFFGIVNFQKTIERSIELR